MTTQAKKPQAAKAEQDKSPKQRLLKNTANGRVFVYNEQLAKLPNLVEIEGGDK